MSLRIANGTRAHCALNEQFTYDLEWSPAQDYPAGTQIELRSHRFSAFVRWLYVNVTMENADINFRMKFRPSLSDMMASRYGSAIFRATLSCDVRKNQICKVTLTTIPPTYAGINHILSIWTNEEDDSPSGEAEPMKEEGSDCEMTLSSATVERLSVYSRPMPAENGKVRTCIVPEDRFGNPAEFIKPVDIQLEWEGKTWHEDIHKTTILDLSSTENIARLKVTVPMKSLGTRENIANGDRQGSDLVVTGNPAWASPDNNLRAAFGEFHWHTNLSGDGHRSIEDALVSARDYLNMDFAAPGDHNTRGERWDKAVEALDEFNDPDGFATFYGWEGNSGYGHENYYFTDKNHPLGGKRDAGLFSGSPEETTDLLKGYDNFLAVPHHTNSTSGIDDKTGLPFWGTYQWGTPVEHIRLVEIFQCLGNQERNTYSDAWRGWHQNNSASVQDALRLGYKVGFTGGSDNHCAWPGRMYDETGTDGSGAHNTKSVILTGAWTDRVERQSIYDALWNRHTWAVWDTRAIVHFAINGVLMGGELNTSEGEELVVQLKLSAEDALQSVEIVSEEDVVWCESFSALDIDIEIPLGVAEKSTHFYLRALQRNGGLIYASPVFVDVG